MLKKKNYLLLIAGVMLGGNAYAQATNMRLPQQVGVYSANSQNTNQMQLPAQVGAYQKPNDNRVYVSPYTVNPQFKPNTFVDYSKNPTMKPSLYENVNGYKTPDKYTLQTAKTQELANQTKKINEIGTEYYLLLGYGLGSFTGSGLTNSEVIPPMNNISEGLGDPKVINVGFGVMQNRDMRFDVSYTNLSGLRYDSTAYSEEQWCGPTEFATNGDFLFDCIDESRVNGGGISSNALMLNVQIPLTEFVGKLFDGMVTPYIGGGFGMAFNTVDDYTVIDEYGDAVTPKSTDGSVYNPDTGEDYAGNYQYDGRITHFGATSNNFAWNIEAGLSINLDKKTVFDIYFKKSNYGTVKSKDFAYYDYYQVDIVDPTDNLNQGTDGTIDYCTTQAIDEGFAWNEETDWCESEPYEQSGYVSNVTEKGKIETTEIGVKLRLIF